MSNKLCADNYTLSICFILSLFCIKIRSSESVNVKWLWTNIYFLGISIASVKEIISCLRNSGGMDLSPWLLEMYIKKTYIRTPNYCSDAQCPAFCLETILSWVCNTVQHPVVVSMDFSSHTELEWIQILLLSGCMLLAIFKIHPDLFPHLFDKGNIRMVVFLWKLSCRLYLTQFK